MLCPPYDVIDAQQRAELLHANADNAVELILPDLPDHEVLRLRVREVEARHRRARIHRSRYRAW